MRAGKTARQGGGGGGGAGGVGGESEGSLLYISLPPFFSSLSDFAPYSVI